jgi:hypothetical protein
VLRVAVKVGEALKQEITKTIPATKATTIKIGKVLCDICLADAAPGRYGGGGGVCQLCDRDVCAKHKRYDDDGSDYPDKYCAICYELKFKKYAKDYADVEAEYERQLNALEAKVRAESLDSYVKEMKE